MTVGAAQDVVLGRTADGADGGGRWFMTLTHCHCNHVPSLSSLAVIMFDLTHFINFFLTIIIMIIIIIIIVIIIIAIFMYTSTYPPPAWRMQ